MREMHLRQSGFNYSACVKTKNKYKKIKESGDSKYIYKNELDKARFQRDMTHGDFNGLLTRTDADTVLRDKASNIAKTSVDLKSETQ